MLVWMTRKPDRGRMSSLGMGGKTFSRKMSPNTARYPKLLMGASLVTPRHRGPVAPTARRPGGNHIERG